uniref:Uncharacterized protein n=1 Tax=Quercus lobata TaxID=97700 RepID=A0A7N2LMV2_QUELO
MGLVEKGRRIRELTSVVQKRFKFPENSVELYAEKVNNRGLCAIAQAESLRHCSGRVSALQASRRACCPEDYDLLNNASQNVCLVFSIDYADMLLPFPKIMGLGDPSTMLTFNIGSFVSLFELFFSSWSSGTHKLYSLESELQRISCLMN